MNAMDHLLGWRSKLYSPQTPPQSPLAAGQKVMVTSNLNETFVDEDGGYSPAYMAWRNRTRPVSGPPLQDAAERRAAGYALMPAVLTMSAWHLMTTEELVEKAFELADEFYKQSQQRKEKT